MNYQLGKSFLSGDGVISGPTGPDEIRQYGIPLGGLSGVTSGSSKWYEMTPERINGIGVERVFLNFQTPHAHVGTPIFVEVSHISPVTNQRENKIFVVNPEDAANRQFYIDHGYSNGILSAYGGVQVRVLQTFRTTTGATSIRGIFGPTELLAIAKPISNPLPESTSVPPGSYFLYEDGGKWVTPDGTEIFVEDSSIHLDDGSVLYPDGSFTDDEGNHYIRAQLEQSRSESLNEIEANHCFPAGTPVLMADGVERAIETVAIGDMVMAFDGLGELQPRRVTQTHVTPDQELIQIGDLRVTPGREFLSADGTFQAIEALAGNGQIVSVDGDIFDCPPPRRLLAAIHLAPLVICCIAYASCSYCCFNRLSAGQIQLYLAQNIQYIFF